MKKIFVMLLIFPFVLMGCTVVEVNDKDLNKIVDTILGKNLNLHNQTSNGYKYYLPRGTRVIDSTSYNEKLFSDGYKYYLYVDIVNSKYSQEQIGMKKIWMLIFLRNWIIIRNKDTWK